MNAIILAAGSGTRLRPLTDHTPKCLLPLGRQPLLHRSLTALVRARIDACVIVTGFCGPLIEQAVESLHLPFPVHFAHNKRFAATNNNYSLWLGMTQAGRHDLLLLDSDILFADRILDLLLDHPSRDALVMRTSGVLGDEEIKVERDARGCIRRIGKEIGAASAAGESIGMEKFSASTAARLHDILGERKERNEFYEASFQQLIEAGVCVTGVDAGEVPCMEIDTPEDYAVARGIADALDQRIKTSR